MELPVPTALGDGEDEGVGYAETVAVTVPGERVVSYVLVTVELSTKADVLAFKLTTAEESTSAAAAPTDALALELTDALAQELTDAPALELTDDEAKVEIAISTTARPNSAMSHGTPGACDEIVSQLCNRPAKKKLQLAIRTFVCVSCRQPPLPPSG